MKLNQARTLAERIVAALDPFCERIEIAGSIRRECPEVNDLDLVVLPSDVAGLKSRCRQNATVVQNGKMNYIIRLSNGFQVDIFIAAPRQRDLFGDKPGNFGTLLLCRTGSRQFNIWFANQATARGFHWNPYWGLYHNGLCCASEDEKELFKYLKLRYITPQQREGGLP